jgi:hypothetical protein
MAGTAHLSGIIKRDPPQAAQSVQVESGIQKSEEGEHPCDQFQFQIQTHRWWGRLSDAPSGHGVVTEIYPTFPFPVYHRHKK